MKKNRTSIRQDIEEKILSMYAIGMTIRDMEAHLGDIYGVDASNTKLSRIPARPCRRQGMVIAVSGSHLRYGILGRKPLSRPQ